MDDDMVARFADTGDNTLEVIAALMAQNAHEREESARLREENARSQATLQREMQELRALIAGQTPAAPALPPSAHVQVRC